MALLPTAERFERHITGKRLASTKKNGLYVKRRREAGRPAGGANQRNPTSPSSRRRAKWLGLKFHPQLLASNG
jgi:hypothetical protein